MKIFNVNDFFPASGCPFRPFAFGGRAPIENFRQPASGPQIRKAGVSHFATETQFSFIATVALSVVALRTLRLP